MALSLTNTSKIMLVLVTGFFLFISYASYAKNVEDALALLLSSYQGFKADFSQTMTDEQGEVMQRSQGEVMLLRPDRLRWYTKTPMQQWIIADGQRLWIYDVDLAQVTIEHLDRLSQGVPAMLLSGSVKNIQKHFFIMQKKDDQQQRFTLTPKNKEDAVQWIILIFKQNKIHEIQVMDPLHQLTVLDFEHVTLNVPLAENLFHFKPPPGVDVIDNRT